eukprot:1758457-Rhodomonas_salina.1
MRRLAWPWIVIVVGGPPCPWEPHAIQYHQETTPLPAEDGEGNQSRPPGSSVVWRAPSRVPSLFLARPAK